MTRNFIKLTQRKADIKDCQLLYCWKNNPAVRRASFKQEKIQLNNHIHWLASALNNPDIKIHIMEKDSSPVGMYRLNFDGDTATIDITVDQKFRGQGIGKIIIRKIILNAKKIGVKKLIAEVKENNLPSKKLFLTSGFIKVKEGVKFKSSYSTYEFNVK